MHCSEKISLTDDHGKVLMVTSCDLEEGHDGPHGLMADGKLVPGQVTL